MGDPAGIGPEIIMRSLDAERLRQAGAMVQSTLALRALGFFMGPPLRPGFLGVVLDEGSAAVGH